MEIIVLKLEPVDRQANWKDRVNDVLAGCFDGVVYTTPAYNQGEEEKVVHIFALK